MDDGALLNENVFRISSEVWFEVRNIVPHNNFKSYTGSSEENLARRTKPGPSFQL